MTAKAVLRPFEPTKLNGGGGNGNDDDDGREELAAEMKDLEEHGVQEDNDDEDVVDVVAGMSEGEREEWEATVAPIRDALFKV